MSFDAHMAISRRVCDLNADMLERRKALNAEHYIPRLSVIQTDCAAIGHVRGRLKQSLTNEVYECGYCGAAMEETRHHYALDAVTPDDQRE